MNPTIIMISSAAGLGDAARCKEAGIVHYMTKPVIKSELFDVIVDALGREQAKEEAHQSEPDFKIRDLKPARALHILAVEDDAISQRVAVGYLEQAGHQVTLASTGREAISMVDSLGNDSNESFDLILMDLQMPEMDGLKTTAVIRDRERETGTHVPIIAVTAAAMSGDKERCLAAGMDAYLPKPISVEQLLNTIELQTGIAKQASSLAAGANAEDDATGDSENESVFVNFEAAKKNIPGAMEGMRKTYSIFLKESARLVSELEHGLAHSNGAKVKRAAHSLYGSARILCADPLRDAAREMETLGQEKNFDQAKVLLPQLLEVIEKTSETIEKFIDGSRGVR